jgi:hypothetical protein
MSSGLRLRVQRLMNPNPRRSSRASAWKSIGVIVRTRVLHGLGVEGGVAGREDPALADAEQADLVEAVALADELDASGQVAIDVVVERQPAVGTGRIAPVDHVQIDPEIEQVADERAVLLQVGHRCSGRSARRRSGQAS